MKQDTSIQYDLTNSYKRTGISKDLLLVNFLEVIVNELQ